MGDLSSLTNICEPPWTCMFIIMFILTDVPQTKCMYKAKHTVIQIQMHAGCTCFMFIFVLGFLGQYHEATDYSLNFVLHESIMSTRFVCQWPGHATHPWNQPSCAFLWSCCDGSCCDGSCCGALSFCVLCLRSTRPQCGQTVRSSMQRHPHSDWMQMLEKLLPNTCCFCLFHRLMTKQTFLISSVKQITPNLSCETYSGQTYLNKCHDSQHRQNVWLIAGNCD